MVYLWSWFLSGSMIFIAWQKTLSLNKRTTNALDPLSYQSIHLRKVAVSHHAQMPYKLTDNRVKLLMCPPVYYFFFVYLHGSSSSDSDTMRVSDEKVEHTPASGNLGNWKYTTIWRGRKCFGSFGDSSSNPLSTSIIHFIKGYPYEFSCKRYWVGTLGSIPAKRTQKPTLTSAVALIHTVTPKKKNLTISWVGFHNWGKK